MTTHSERNTLMNPQALIILSLAPMLSIESLALAKALRSSRKDKANAEFYEKMAYAYKHVAENAADGLMLQEEEIKMLKEQIAELQKEH